MRRVMMTLAVIGALAFTVAVGPAQVGAGEHAGCKGIDQAFNKASTKGKEALTVVSEKFGCGTVTPDPVDPLECPAGTTSLARYTYAGTKTGPLDPYGYATWVGSWTLVSGGTDARIHTEYDHTNGDGFYWWEATTDRVTKIIVGSTEGEIRTINDPDVNVPVNRNDFVNRDGWINAANLCGATAA